GGHADAADRAGHRHQHGGAVGAGPGLDQVGLEAVGVGGRDVRVDRDVGGDVDDAGRGGPLGRVAVLQVTVEYGVVERVTLVVLRQLHAVVLGEHLVGGPYGDVLVVGLDHARERDDRALGVDDDAR